MRDVTPSTTVFLASLRSSWNGKSRPRSQKTVKFRSDPAGRAICGGSAGGTCAFTAAWQRPDLSGKVLPTTGGFTNIRGGDAYPGLIREAELKSIRVSLQDGANDLDNPRRDWPLGNQSMAALRFTG